VEKYALGISGRQKKSNFHAKFFRKTLFTIVLLSRQSLFQPLAYPVAFFRLLVDIDRPPVIATGPQFCPLHTVDDQFQAAAAG